MGSAMNEATLTQGNWLYRNPALFEEVNGHLSDKIAALIWREIAKGPPQRLGNVLDVGCGTGRLLHNLARYCDRLVGVDINPAMLSHARARLPEAEFIERDMRRLGDLGAFDLVICVGSVVMYMYSNDDLFDAVANLRRQVAPDGCLLLGLTDAGAIIGDHSRLRTKFAIATDGFSATASASYQFDGRSQRMLRVRTWRTSTGEDIEDRAEYRLIFPLELDFYLGTAGFSRRRTVSLNGDSLQPRLYVIAAP
jgi:SAM-dependent methyltransferase